jgi:RNA polymerase sigma factor (sigma-70 family)
MSHRERRASSRDDLVQEVFARLWSHRSRYQGGAPVKHYLLGISANVLRESRARTRRQTPVDIREFESIVDARLPSPPSHAQSAEQLEVVRALIAGLPTGQRQAVELVYLAGLTHDEIIRQMGCSRNALRKNLSRARRKLRRLVPPSP